MTTNIIIPTDPNHRKELKNFVRNASDSMTRIDAEKDHIKELRDEVKEKFQLPPKFFNKLVKAYHKDSHKKEVEEAADFDELYTVVLIETGSSVTSGDDVEEETTE